jgi:hypothetical protein
MKIRARKKSGHPEEQRLRVPRIRQQPGHRKPLGQKPENQFIPRVSHARRHRLEQGLTHAVNFRSAPKCSRLPLKTPGRRHL